MSICESDKYLVFSQFETARAHPSEQTEIEDLKILFCPGGVSLKFHKSLKLGGDLSAKSISKVISHLETSKECGGENKVSLIISDHGLKIQDKSLKKCNLDLAVRDIAFVICAARQKKLAIISLQKDKNKKLSNFAHILSSDKEQEILLLNDTINIIFEKNGKKLDSSYGSKLGVCSSKESLSTRSGTYFSKGSSNSERTCVHEPPPKLDCPLNKKPSILKSLLNRQEAESTAETFIFVPMDTWNKDQAIPSAFLGENIKSKNNDSYKNDSGIGGSFSCSTDKQETFQGSKVAVDPLSDFSSWYHPEFSREDAERHLSTRGVGCFVIRVSNTWKDCLVMSVSQCAQHKAVAHYLIRNDRGRLFFDGHDESWDTIESLVAHLQMPILRFFRSK